MRLRTNTNPVRGPFHYRSPARIFWRTVRGMIPHKTYRGKVAMARMQVQNGHTPNSTTTTFSSRALGGIAWGRAGLAADGGGPTCWGSPRVDSTGAQMGGRTYGWDRTDGRTDGRTARGVTVRTGGRVGRLGRTRRNGTDG